MSPARRDRFVIADPDRQRVLVAAGRDAPALPGSAVEPWSWTLSWVPEVAAAARAQLGLDPVLLHDDLPSRRDRAPGGPGTWAAETRGRIPDPPPAGLTWAAPAVLDGDDRSDAEAWLAELTAPEGAAPARQPWQRPGWFAEAGSWIRTRLRAAGRVPGTIDQRSVSPSACLLAADDDAGGVVFKALAGGRRIEPALAAWLDRRAHGLVPGVVAADPARGWLLSERLPGPVLNERADPGAWETTLARLATLQRASRDWGGSLGTLGVPRRDPDWLAVHAPERLADGAALRERGASSADAAALAALAPAVARGARALAASGLPTTLTHGDFHPMNVLLDATGAPRLFDWSDAGLAHPFLDAGRFFDWFFRPASDAHPLLGEPDVERRLRDAYLRGWAGLVDAATLERSFALARALSGAHHLAIAGELEASGALGAEPRFRPRLAGVHGRILLARAAELKRLIADADDPR